MRLSNGLLVLTKEVHAAPVVQVMVFYKVGARNESVGKTGVSHLLEHMMFKGTKTLKPGEIDRQFDLVGAPNNAWTSEDMTAYHETLAANRLELALKIEADRMVNATFDPAEHKREMTVVRSELEGGENSPDTLLYQAVLASAFQAHPYRWPVIGWRADVENVSRDEMYAYYKNWYAPNNAILVLVGDFDTNKTLGLVRQHFGKIPARPVNRNFITPEPPQRGERRVEVRREGTTPRTLLAYHVPRFGHPDYYALDVLSTILSGGRSARLSQSLVETGIATSAYAYNADHADPFLMILGATAQQKKTATDLEKALLADVDKLQTDLVTNAELARAQNQIEASFTFERDSIPDQAQTLGRYAVWGDWRYSDRYLSQVKKVTAVEVQRVAKKYLGAENRTVGHFVPTSAPSDPSPPAREAASQGIARYKPTQAGKATLFSPRSMRGPVKPGVAPRPVRGNTKTPPATRVVLPNGLVVLVQPNRANATVSVSGSILSAGNAVESMDKPGLAAFTAGMLQRGTEKRTSLQIAEAMEEVGASVEISSGAEYLSFAGRSLRKDFARLLDVLSDQLRHPKFPADQMEKLKTETLSVLAQEAEDPSARAARAFSGAVYPPNHPYWTPSVEAQIGAVQGFKQSDLQAFHTTHYGPNTMILVVVGDVDPEAAVGLVKQYFADWERKQGLASPIIPPTPSQNQAKRLVIPLPDKSQVDVVYGYATGIARSAPDFYAVRILNWVLGGGSFGSRLMANLRDKQGLVYGVYSDFEAGLGAGPFTVAFGTNPSNADKAVAEMQQQIGRLQTQGITPDELTRAKNFITGSYPIRLATNAGVAQQLLAAEVFQLGLDYPSRYAALYNAVTLQEVNAAARKYLDPERGTLVLAGPYIASTNPAKPTGETR